MAKQTIAIIFGGTNTEHEVSIASAKSVIDNLDHKKYKLFPVKITKKNDWLIPKDEYRVGESLDNLVWDKSNPYSCLTESKINVVFPLLHGPYGEDGTIQGLLDTLRIPYVGCGVLASAICMDKVIQKQLASSIGIQSPKYIYLTKYQWQQDPNQWMDKIQSQLKFPCFVKPANQGSSIGISKAETKNQLQEAIDSASMLDLKIIVEQAIPHVREIECSILGNNNPKASILGEIIPSNDFYDYDSKYVDGKSQEIIPADISQKIAKQIRKTAIKAFKTLNCSGLARIDFLINNETKVFYLNEINTMPGFTQISMYPKLWEASGVVYSDLLDQLIELGLKKHAEKSQLVQSHNSKSAWC